MKNWRNRIGTMLTAVGVVGAMGAGCGGSKANPRGPKDADELNRIYQNLYLEIPTKGGALDRELFQLAFPTTNSVSVWHLYEKGATERLGMDAYSIRKCATSDDNAVVSTNCVGDPKIVPSCAIVGNVDCATKPLSDQEPKAERISFQGLEPGAEYEIKVSRAGQVVSSLRARTVPKETFITADGKTTNLSFLAFSCNNPYGVTEGDKLKSDDPRWVERMREKQNSLRLFADRANNVIKLKDYPRPAFALGLGDQVYVDGDNLLGNHTAIFTGVRSHPSFLPDNRIFGPLLDVVYRAHFAMPSFHWGLQGVPTAMIWDDHELQDGWDAKDKSGNILNSLEGFEGYPQAALDAFLGHQALRNPGDPKTQKLEVHHAIKDRPMDVAFSWGEDIQVRMLDTRSIELPIDESKANDGAYMPWKAQLGALETWLSNDERKDKVTLFVLGLASPLSLATGIGAKRERAANFAGCKASIKDMDERCDDLNDLWAAKKAARRMLIEKLAPHFLSNRQHRLLVLSGDVHFSAISYLSTGEGSCWHDADTGRSCDVHKINPAFREKLKAEYQCKVGKVLCPDEKKTNKKEVDACKPTNRETPACGSEEHVLWGWEVISSGITNDALGIEDTTRGVKTWLLTQGTVDDAHDNSLMTAWPRGAIYGTPSFAEILVSKPQNGKPFSISVVFFPSDFNGEEVNIAEEFEKHKDPWGLEPYKYFEGSRKNAKWQAVCQDPQTLTRVPLDWDHIPNADTGGTILSLVHACSVINTRKGEASKIADRDD